MNNDLISRKALLAEYCEGCNALAKKMCGQDICGVAMMINDAPSVDAVEVVRCKDCRYFEAGVEYYGGGTKDVCRLLGRQMQDDDFCSYGERREDG